MSAIVTMDAAGRVVIPKAVRAELRLQAGDSLVLDANGERMTLRPVRSGSALQRERDVWIFRSGRRISAEKTGRVLEEERGDRERIVRDLEA